MPSTLKRLVGLELKANECNTSLIVLGCGLLMPVVFTMTPSNLAQAAMPGELFLPLLTIFAFGSLFLPEQTVEIGAVINSKQTQLWWLYLLRFIWYAVVLAMLATVLIGVLCFFQCWGQSADTLVRLCRQNFVSWEHHGFELQLIAIAGSRVSLANSVFCIVYRLSLFRRGEYHDVHASSGSV